MHAGEKEM